MNLASNMCVCACVLAFKYVDARSIYSFFLVHRVTNIYVQCVFCQLRTGCFSEINH